MVKFYVFFTRLCHLHECNVTLNRKIIFAHIFLFIFYIWYGIHFIRMDPMSNVRAQKNRVRPRGHTRQALLFNLFIL
jgi:hypothetical protein